MRTQQTFQIIGIGDFELISIKQKAIDFPIVSKEGNELSKKLKEQGKTAVYCWVNVSGKEYTQEQIFYDISGKKVQKINRTEKVNKFEVIDRTELYDLAETTTYLLNCNETTRKNFDKKVKDNAVKFVFKKSSRGLKFHIAYIYRSQQEILMVTGIGSISKGIEEFKKQKQAVSKKKTILKNVVEVNAEELENEILAVIK